MSEHKEAATDIGLLIMDENLRKLVLTWPILNREGGSVDTREAADLSGVPKPRIKAVIKRALAHGLVYVDGSVNTYAQSYLAGLALKAVRNSQ